MTGDKTMQHHATAMSGPEFLEAVAGQNEANGLDINADVFRTRAREWAHDKRALQYLRDENDTLTTRMAEAQRVMQGV